MKNNIDEFLHKLIFCTDVLCEKKRFHIHQNKLKHVLPFSEELSIPQRPLTVEVKCLLYRVRPHRALKLQSVSRLRCLYPFVKGLLHETDTSRNVFWELRQPMRKTMCMALLNR